MNRAAIIGTAGHIDHGKTLLIKLLTGMDTDRLKEERKRGISIELGFAHLELPSGRVCGVVDVPGHERFIRNMLAGAAGIDVILFVIAADEGVMPQTREHMDILSFLGVSRGVVALTKIDMVDPDWLDLVTEDVREYLRATPLNGAPIVPVSSVNGQGKDLLLKTLDEQLEQLEAAQRGRFVRLPIDRVFVMDGFGTVVTGTLWGGALADGSPVMLQPRGLETRIKQIEVHGSYVTEAQAGQRVAVCLHGISRDQVERGDWLVPLGDLRPVQKLDVRLRLVPGLKKPLKNRARIRFHLGAGELLGRILLLESDELPPGGESLAQIQLESLTVAERGDRFVIRSYSPMRTIGGGTVLDVSGSRRRRFRAEDLDALRVAEEGTIHDRILESVGRQKGRGLLEAELTQVLGQPPQEIRQAVGELLERSELRRVGKSRLVVSPAMEEAGRVLEAAILEQEKAQALRFGPSKSELKSRFEKKIHPETAEAWIQEAITAGRVFTRGDRLRRSGPTLELGPAHSALRDRMLTGLEGAGFGGPAQKAFLAGFESEPEAADLLQLLLAEERVIRIPPDILLHGRLYKDLRTRVQEYFESRTEMAVGDIKDTLGVSRKQAVPILEFLDRVQWTERRGDVRTAGRRLAEEE